MRGNYDSSEENKDNGDRTMENIDAMAQRNGNGRYVVGSRWHETNLIIMMRHVLRVLHWNERCMRSCYKRTINSV